MNELDAIRRRVEAATPGPWNSMTEETGNGENIYYTVEHGNDQLLDMVDTSRQGWVDAEFIAHAREDIPYLLSLIDSLKGTSDE